MIKKAYLAGGCFWGLEDLFRKESGIVNTEVGYTGGPNPNPTYRDHEGHAEAMLIEYDDEVTSYRMLLEFFFRVHNPTTVNRQGNDMGSSYRSAIFHQSDEEKSEAQDMIDFVNQSGKWPSPVVTTLEALDVFYDAEDYHQDYLVKNPGGYTCHVEYFKSYD
jgi:peptide-methionine (S)-S-oxide reductase